MEEPRTTSAPPRRGHGGPMGMARGGEKAKDLIGTWKKLLGYCRRYRVALVVALLCAVLGTVLTLAGPDQLSDMTDTITAGIAPDQAMLEAVTDTVSQTLTDNLEAVTQAISAGLGDQAQLTQKAGAILASPDFTPAEKQAFQETLAGLAGATDPSQQQALLLALPEGMLEALLSPVTVHGVTLAPQDQVPLLTTLGQLDPEDPAALAGALTDLPAEAQAALFTDVAVEGTTLSGADQQAMLDLFTHLDGSDTNALLAAIDSLPASVYNLVKPSIDMDTVVGIGLFLVALYAISYVLSAVQGWIMATITQRVSKEMRSDISHKINRLPMWYYNRTTTGDVLSRVTNDVDTIGQSLNQSIGGLLSAVVLLLGSLVMMLLTSVWMTLTAVVASLLGFALMFAIMGKSQKYFRRQQKHLGQLNGHIEEIYTGHTVVKAYNGEAHAQAQFDEMNANLCSSNFKAQCLSGLMMPIMSFIGNFGYVAVCVVGGAMALNDAISFGVIVAFMLYVRYFTQPLSQIAQAVQSLQSAAAAGERVFEFLEAQEMEDEAGKPTALPQVQGKVEFRHVTFGYEDTDTTVIHDFSAVAQPGQKIAIVGPTGAGKTTLVNLLMRFHEIQQGEILIDGISTKDLSRQAVHSLFCMVLQDTWLFEGTVRENLVYCTPGVSDETMEKACKAVGLHHFIRTLPKGYDTILNDQVSLSQGQKQQLTIARAMIADKPMLILDEATSSVDTRTEQKIQAAMDQLMEHRTSFVIAHRLSTIKNADLILVLREGDIVESGTHDQLLQQGGFYAELYNSQFEQVS